MNPRVRFVIAAGTFAALLPLMAQKGPDPKAPPARVANKQPVHDDDSAQGQRVFKQNCARCHDAPQGFPPQISGTVLRHMRVRANLSARDEKALLHFMNP
jgi:mono/diheme cytochrome c family protein